MQNDKNGFTVVEATMALSIGVLILSAVTYLMIQSFQISRDAFADYYLAAQGRVLRERLLRRIDGNNGMRVAVWDTLEVIYQNAYAEKMYYKYLDMSANGDWPENADEERVLLRRKLQMVAYNSTADSDFKFPLKDRIIVQDMFHKLYSRNDITCEPRHVFSEFYLKIEIDGVSYDQFYYVKTVIVNDENN